MSQNFSDWEFDCNCGGCVHPPVPSELYLMCEFVRLLCGGLPISFSSAYRCPKWNASEGGSIHSFHLRMMAVDIRVPGFMIDDIYEKLCRLFPNTYGFGKYDTFIHVDIDPTKSRRWDLTEENTW